MTNEQMRAILSGIDTPDGRAVAADALEEAGRDVEAKLLRTPGTEVAVSDAGNVVAREHADLATRHRRTARPGEKLGFRRHEGRQKVGSVIRRKDGMHLVVESSPLRHVSEAYIEDMDAWGEYPKGPGRYSSYTTIPVEETNAERREREGKESAKSARQEAAEVEKKCQTGIWAPFAAMPSVYQLPAGIDPQSITWEVVADDTKASRFGHGMTSSIGTLPDGTRIGRVTQSMTDDYRVHYLIPQHIMDRHAERNKSAERLEWLEVRHRIPSMRPADMTAEQLAAEWDRLAAEHHERYGDVPAGLSPAMQARQKEAEELHPKSWTEAVHEIVDQDAEGAGLRREYAVRGSPNALDRYRNWVATTGAEIAAEWQAEYEEAAAEWIPKLAEEFGAEAATKAAADVKGSHDRFAHIEAASEFEEQAESLRKEAAEAKRKGAAKAARKA